MSKTDARRHYGASGDPEICSQRMAGWVPVSEVRRGDWILTFTEFYGLGHRFPVLRSMMSRLSLHLAGDGYGSFRRSVGWARCIGSSMGLCSGR